MKLIIWSIFLSILSLFIFLGYQVGVQDQKIYIPLILNEIDKTTLIKDFLLFGNSNPTNRMMFDELIIFVMKITHLNLYQIFFVLTIISRTIFCYSLIKIVQYFTKSKIFSLISPIFIMNNLTVYGTATVIFDNFLIPRTLVLPLGFVSIGLLLHRKIIFSAIVLAIAFLLHPPTALIFIPLFYFEILLRIRTTKKIEFDTIVSATIPVVAFVLLNVFSSAVRVDYFSTIDTEFEKILRFGVPYIFITNWNVYTLLWFIPTLIFFFVAAKSKINTSIDSKKRREIIFLLGWPVFLTFFSLVSVDIFKMHFISMLQLSRSLIIWKIMSSLFFLFYVYEKLTNRPRDLAFNFILIAMTISLLVKEAVIFVFLPFFIYFFIKREVYD